MKFNINKEKIKEAVSALKHLPWLVGENAFSFFITIIFIAILISSLFFVRYIVLIDHYYRAPPSQLPILNEKTLESILEIWQQRQNRLNNAGNKAYPDFFLPNSK